MAVNTEGSYIAVHYGDNKRDLLRLVNIHRDEIYTVTLQHVHSSKTAIHVSDHELISIIDFDRILLIGKKGEIKNIIKIHPKRDGTSTICGDDCVSVATYVKTSGEAHFLIFRNDGKQLYEREFPDENFLTSTIEDSIILLRGSQSLFCYNINHQYIQ